MLLLLLALWPLMGMFPPFRPTMPAAELADYYRTHQSGIIVGGIVMMLASSLFLPFIALISVHMRRMEGPSGPLAYTQMLSAVFGFVPAFTAAILFSAAAYRPERSIETIQMLSDLAFLSFVIPALPGSIQLVSIGLAVLGDKGDAPVFPRWIGYLNLWSAVLFIPGALVALFKTGPFAWNGALSFWLVAVVFGSWVNVMCWALLRARKRQLQPA
jgi:hypothetical protein